MERPARGNMFQIADVYDWMILQRGHLFGGYTLRVIREKIPESQRRNYDIYLGVSVYESQET